MESFRRERIFITDTVLAADSQILQNKFKNYLEQSV
jgi:hypothetical protein